MLAVVAGALAMGADAARRPGVVEPMSGVEGLREAQLEAKQRADFDAWAARHGRAYATGRAEHMLGADGEYERRFATYKANLAHVEYLAATGANRNDQGGWVLSTEGPFMDHTHEEFAATLTLRAKSDDSLPREFVHAGVSAEEASASIDWREKGAVTPIKNQGQCGSCWAFSTVGSIEGANFLASGELVSLSEQELVSCDDNGDQGCNGGLMDNAFGWVIKNGGLDTEGDYPYVAGGGVAAQCNAKKSKKAAVTIDDFSDVPVNSEDGLRQALSQQPVSVGVDALLWQFYGGGIFHGVFGYCGTSLDHGVLLVAMDMDDQTYTIKNSWGPTWGEEGYIRLPQDRGAEGMCGIANSASGESGGAPAPAQRAGAQRRCRARLRPRSRPSAR